MSWMLWGLIPAHAGNTPEEMLELDVVGAHPRSRGEHNDEWGTVNNEAGSSPLARGTPGCVNPEGAQARLIPARAGNTSWTKSPAWAVPAHPRSRGEHSR